MDSLAQVVAHSVGALNVTPTDAGAAALAVTYARRIDDGDDIQKVGPLLLATLEALLMTPRARASVMKGAESGPQLRSPLDELRRRREERSAA